MMVGMWIIASLDRSDDTTKAWAVQHEHEVVLSIKEEMDEHDDLHLPDTLEAVLAVLATHGYVVWVTRQDETW